MIPAAKLASEISSGNESAASGQASSRAPSTGDRFDPPISRGSPDEVEIDRLIRPRWVPHFQGNFQGEFQARSRNFVQFKGGAGKSMADL